MDECKHGLRQGCAYCHARTVQPTTQPKPKRQSRASRLAEQMNERLTNLNKRLRALRGQ